MSTIKVNNIDPPNVGEGVSIDGLQMPTAGAFSNRNLIINGATNVAQRGTSSTASNYGTVDRIRTAVGGGTITQSQEDLISTDTPYSLGFRKNWRITNTAPITDLANHSRRTLFRIEAQDIANSGWDYTNSNSYITLSMWVRSSIAQTFNWFMQSLDGTVQRYPWEVTLAANTWTKVTKSFPGNSNLTFDNNNELGLIIDIGMYWGTAFTTSTCPLDQWGAYAPSDRTRDFDATWGQTTGATFDLVGVQLEVGSKATPFEHESYGQTLAKCQRYYQKIDYGQGDVRIGIGQAYNDTIADFSIPYVTTMRDNPTALEQSGTKEDYGLVSASGNGGDCTSVPSFRFASKHSITIRMQDVNHLAAGNAVTAYLDNSNAFLAWSAEL